MKKTEKIEVRISHAEKERLTDLAYNEGQSVSELVRGLARRYVDMNTSTRKAPLSGWFASASLIMGGLLFGTWFGMHVLYPHFAHSHDDVSHYNVAMTLSGGDLGDTRLRSMVRVENGTLSPIPIGSPQDARYTFTANRDGQRMDVTVCQTSSNACHNFTTELTEGLTVHDRNLPSGERLMLSVAPHQGDAAIPAS